MSNEKLVEEASTNTWIVWSASVVTSSAVAAGLYFFTSLSLWWIAGITVAVLALLVLAYCFFSDSEE